MQASDGILGSIPTVTVLPLQVDVHAIKLNHSLVVRLLALAEDLVGTLTCQVGSLGGRADHPTVIKGSSFRAAHLDTRIIQLCDCRHVMSGTSLGRDWLYFARVHCINLYRRNK